MVVKKFFLCLEGEKYLLWNFVKRNLSFSELLQKKHENTTQTSKISVAPTLSEIFEGVILAVQGGLQEFPPKKPSYPYLT